MAIEMLILAVIVIFVFTYNGKIDGNKFIDDNFEMMKKLKEDDYDFYVKAKYGVDVDPDVLFQKRIRNGVIVGAVVLVFFINNLSYVYILLALLAGFLIFKMDYTNLKNYYKRHLNEINSMLPYYLKGLEILIQHYTVPVAIGKSVNDAPIIFREGLQKMIDEINSGDSSIDPYMNFAKDYPVRDSMRMMRLLYRLSLGRQERKQEQMITFSKTISNLQQKARETKYKDRLDRMEGKTMSMLVTTGLGIMVLLIIAVLNMISM